MKTGIKEKFKNINIAQIIVDVLAKIFIFIYEFIFIWEDDNYQNTDIIENEKQRLEQIKSSGQSSNLSENNASVAIKNNIKHINSKEYEQLKSELGSLTADYIFKLRQEADYMVEEHGLIQGNTIMVVIPPEKVRENLLNPEYFESMMEKIYSQYNQDIILKPGNIRLLKPRAETPYLEMQIETYTLKKEIITSAG